MKLFSFAASLAIVLACATPTQAALFDVEAKITATDAAAGDWFGRSVSISGNTALVGAPRDDDGGWSSGSAYLFDVTTGNQIAKLTADDAEEDDRFGHAVAISGNTALVGALRDDDGGDDSGSAYLFDVPTGNQLAKLTAADAAAFDLFGSSVAISGNTALVGAQWGSGAAYLFDATTGNQLAKLTPADAAGGDEFGISVAISGNTALVGAVHDDDGGFSSGSAYLFDVTTGNQLAKLTADDAAAFDSFGISVAISGNTALVGAFQDDDGGTNSGSAYLFDVNTGNQIAKLTATDSAAGDKFGSAVALSGNSALVGDGTYADYYGGSDSATAYLFDATTGKQLAKLTAADDTEGDLFGSSVAISSNTALVGASGNDDGGDFSGSAYLFENVVPEPSTLLLSTVACTGLFFRRNR